MQPRINLLRLLAIPNIQRLITLSPVHRTDNRNNEIGNEYEGGKNGADHWKRGFKVSVTKFTWKLRNAMLQDGTSMSAGCSNTYSRRISIHGDTSGPIACANVRLGLETRIHAWCSHRLGAPHRNPA